MKLNWNCMISSPVAESPGHLNFVEKYTVKVSSGCSLKQVCLPQSFTYVKNASPGCKMVFFLQTGKWENCPLWNSAFSSILLCWMAVTFFARLLWGTVSLSHRYPVSLFFSPPYFFPPWSISFFSPSFFLAFPPLSFSFSSFLLSFSYFSFLSWSSLKENDDNSKYLSLYFVAFLGSTELILQT